MAYQLVGKEVHLASRPHGTPNESNFSIVEQPVRDPGDGEVVVRNRAISVDPYMRGRMIDAESYVPPFRLGEVMEGGAVGEVIDSRSPRLSPGEMVVHNYGWREYTVAPGERFQTVDTSIAQPSAYLGMLGMPGLTAYVGLFDIAGMVEGDTVFVSGAAGAVGSLVGQFAKLRGASTVIGSAGSAEKVSYLTDELGFDAALNYKDAPVAEQLAQLAPDGISVYFDNVGGDHLEAALGSMRDFGRVAVCGMISQYNATEPSPAPRNLMFLVTKRIAMRGFIVADHMDRRTAFYDEAGAWVRDGHVRLPETVVDGIDNAPDAFLGLFRGANTGKMIVRLDG